MVVGGRHCEQGRRWTYSGTAGATMATLTESPSWGARSNGSASRIESGQVNGGDRSTPKGPMDTYSAFDRDNNLVRSSWKQ